MAGVAVVDKNKLLAALDAVKATVARHKQSDIQRCYCFDGGFIQTYDSVGGTVTPFDCSGLSFAVPAAKFSEIVSLMSDQITLDLKDSWRLYIKSANNTTWMSVYPVKEMPDREVKGAEMFSDSPDAVAAFDAVMRTMGTNATKPELQGIAINNDFMYSCDGPRVTRKVLSRKDPSRSASYGYILIPPAAVEQMKRLGQPDYIFRAGGLLGCKWTASGTIYTCQLLTGDFPIAAADHCLEMYSGQHVWKFPLDIGQAAHRVSLMSPIDPKLVVENIPGTGLILRTESNIQGEGGVGSTEGGATESLAWDCPWAFKFCIKPSYFLDALAVSLKADLTNIVACQDPQMAGRALRVFDEGIDSFTALLQGAA